MLIKEILCRKRHLDSKLLDIDNYLNILPNLNVKDKVSVYNTAIDIKFSLLSKIQSHDVLLNAQNNNNLLHVGNNDLTVYEAVKIRNTLLDKITTLDNLISSGDLTVINIFTLMEQRDSLFDEFMVLDMAILKSDIETDWKGSDK